jgi:hypothetical protein
VSFTSVDLPEPETPVTQTRRPSGSSKSTLLQVVAPRAAHHDLLLRAVAVRGQGDGERAREIAAGERFRAGDDFGGRALRDDAAAGLAGAGSHVDHVVGGADRLLVVLDHDHRVAEVAQPLQRFDEARVVALVQADRRLIEHVHHAGQSRADLAREADALRFAARERGRRPVEREIVEADVDQELEAVGDLAHDALGDLPLCALQRH